MNADNIEIASDKPSALLDELQRLLEMQIALVRQGKIDDVERLSVRISDIVEEMKQRGVPELDEFKDRSGRLGKLYKELILTVAAQKDNIGKQLQRISEGKKMLGAYRGNV